MSRRPDTQLSWATLVRKITTLELIIKTIEPEREWILAILMLPWLRVRLCELRTERLRRFGPVFDWLTRL